MWFTETFKTRVDNNIEYTCCFTNHDIEVHCCSEIDKEIENKPIFVESIIYLGKKYDIQELREECTGKDQEY